MPTIGVVVLLVVVRFTMVVAARVMVPVRMAGVMVLLRVVVSIRVVSIGMMSLGVVVVAIRVVLFGLFAGKVVQHGEN